MAETALIYGDTGIGKTANLKQLAEYLLKMYKGSVVRLLSNDAGGYTPFRQSGLIEAGSVKVHDMTNSDFLYAELNHASRGYWPLGGNKWAPWKEPTCCYMIEGLESCGENLLSHLSHQTSGRAGFKHSWSYDEEFDGTTYAVGGLDRGHFGIVQSELLRMHRKGFANLPCPWVIWTSKVGRGSEQQTKETIYGPAMVGSAQTEKLPGSFGDCLHLEEIEGNDGKVARVAWFVNHFNKAGVKCLAKSRVSIELVPWLLKKWPNGYIPLYFDDKGEFHGIEQYWQFLLEFVPKAMARMKVEREKDAAKETAV